MKNKLEIHFGWSDFSYFQFKPYKLHTAKILHKYLYPLSEEQFYVINCIFYSKESQ